MLQKKTTEVNELDKLLETEYLKSFDVVCSKLEEEACIDSTRFLGNPILLDSEIIEKRQKK